MGARFDEDLVLDVLEEDGEGELVVLDGRQRAVHQRLVQVKHQRVLRTLPRFARLQRDRKFDFASHYITEGGD